MSAYPHTRIINLMINKLSHAQLMVLKRLVNAERVTVDKDVYSPNMIETLRGLDMVMIVASDEETITLSVTDAGKSAYQMGMFR